MSLISKLIINVLSKAQLGGISGVTTSKKDLYFGSNDQLYFVPHEQEAPNIDIGTVSVGSVPAVSVRKTEDKAILDFVLKNGQDGISAYAAAKNGGYTGTESQFNSSLSAIPTYSPFVISDTEPIDTKLLWIDSSNSNVLKFYNGTAWTPIGSVFS